MAPTDPSSDLAVEGRFAIVPEWLLDADVWASDDIGDAAVACTPCPPAYRLHAPIATNSFTSVADRGC